ncbi:TPA: spore germination protein GerSA [Bacillus anthracis]|uniref:spore germination protein GerSA n=1 Tax=Bacillus anthracis TaxID=1392 RepID=UPI00016D4667|nr:spore germination protein GerSA [Bacillus anthracis]EDS95801.1 spore germination protein [Bacillus anthracis str. A0389]KOR69195.1 spore gernimation protein [Bacillus anthracis]HDR6176704.1 spore germination protein GerSA [Bacillus anthracis]
MGPFNKWIRGEKSFSGQEQADHILNKSISSSLSLNLKHLSKLFSGIPELITRTFPLKNGKEAALIYMEGLVDKTVINVDILRPLLFKEWNEDDFWESSISIGNIKEVQKWTDIEQSLLHGKSILFINGQLSALELDTQAAPKRSIEEPTTESSLKSSHEGFNEVASDSIALIRRYIPNRELKVKAFTVGERAASKVFMLYLADVANEDVIQEMSCRIESIKVDAILTTGELEGFVEDNSYTLFPQLSITERPDTTAHHILDGRIAVVVDRSPGVLIGPMTFSSFFQTIDDYSFRPMIPSFIRLLRFTGLFIAIFAPALYIAMISFHYEVIPLKLLLTIGESRAKIPFPPILEALLMELVLEMLREAAVQAGIVSNVMVIVVSITAVASFIIPNLEMSAGIRLLRFPMMIIASLFGVIGIMVGMAIIIIHILSMESLGVPYGSPFSPLFASDLKDILVRLPWKIMKKRPLSLNLKQENRQSDIEEMEEDK